MGHKWIIENISQEAVTIDTSLPILLPGDRLNILEHVAPENVKNTSILSSFFALIKNGSIREIKEIDSTTIRADIIKPNNDVEIDIGSTINVTGAVNATGTVSTDVGFEINDPSISVKLFVERISQTEFAFKVKFINAAGEKDVVVATFDTTSLT